MTAGIKSLSPYCQRTLFYIQHLQLATGVQHWLAGRKRDIGSINKAATIAGQAIGVGHNHARLLTGHLQITLQLRRIGSDYLVDNDVGRLSGEMGIILDKPTQLGLSQLPCGVI